MKGLIDDQMSKSTDANDWKDRHHRGGRLDGVVGQRHELVDLLEAGPGQILDNRGVPRKPRLASAVHFGICEPRLF
jgi:hypothetical protein